MSALEWVETTAKTLDEAKDVALDQLGVDEQDAEFEVLEEPRPGLFGRTRGVARVRARVRPIVPRPKLDRRDRQRRSRRREGFEQGARPARAGPAAVEAVPERTSTEATGTATDRTDATATTPAATRGGQRTDPEPPSGGFRNWPRGRRALQPRRDQPSGERRTDDRPTDDRPRDDGSTQQMTETELAAQGAVVKDFLEELLEAFEARGTVTLTVPDEEHIDLTVEGDDLGLLIGPKGQTLLAIQELSRSIVQRRMPGQRHGRIRLDVGGYRQRRKEALERFSRQVAAQVRESGTQTALEPMSPPDRKIVHDVVNEIPGVTTTSEGEEPNRRVVILPE
jgi:spoIIIJ-associated protein